MQEFYNHWGRRERRVLSKQKLLYPQAPDESHELVSLGRTKRRQCVVCKTKENKRSNDYIKSCSRVL